MYCNTQESLHSACLGSEVSDGELWNRRMGHLNYSYLNNLKGLVTGLHFKEINHQLNCIPCLKGKQTRKPFKRLKRANRANDILELVHSDVCGPMQTLSWGNARYFLTFIDDKSRKTFVYFLKGKDEVFTKFQEFKKLVETQTGKRLKAVRIDNGREYVNQAMKEFMNKEGIRHQTTVEYTPEQNGVAERCNRIIMEKARAMIEAANLDHRYWAEAVNASVYLKNRSPMKAVLNMTPEEAWTDRKPDVRHL